jgi:hypothetical protein
MLLIQQAFAILGFHALGIVEGLPERKSGFEDFPN